MRIGTTEWLIILAVVIVIFGPTQIPKLSRMIGKSIRGFKDSMTDENAKNAEDKPDETTNS